MWCANLSLSFIVFQNLCNSKVTNFHYVAFSNEDIHWLNVPVHNLLVVQMFNTLQDAGRLAQTDQCKDTYFLICMLWTHPHNLDEKVPNNIFWERRLSLFALLDVMR